MSRIVIVQFKRRSEIGRRRNWHDKGESEVKEELEAQEYPSVRTDQPTVGSLLIADESLRSNCG
jgi:hypothetical protein